MKLLKTNLGARLILLLMMSGFFPLGCSSRQEADLINSSANAGVVVGAYSGFTQRFPNAQSVEWETLSSSLWEARFTQNQEAMAAWLRYDGTIADQGRLLAPAELPTAIVSFLTTYSENPTQTVLTGQNGSDNSPYRILVQQSGVWHRLLFNGNGQLISDSIL
ncbi:hypothetical protein [Larkinella insperata]